MVLCILLALLLLPLAEIAVFIVVGDAIGLWATLALVVLSAVLGVAMVRLQGLITLRRAEASLAAGQPPVAEVFHGACLLLAGLLLIMPGFITDACGILLLLPPLRELLRRRLARRLERGGALRVWTPGRRPPPKGAGPGAMIEGEWQSLDDPPTDPKDGPENLDNPWDRRPPR